jgi:hypothetical protein
MLDLGCSNTLFLGFTGKSNTVVIGFRAVVLPALCCHRDFQMETEQKRERKIKIQIRLVLFLVQQQGRAGTAVEAIFSLRTLSLGRSFSIHPRWAEATATNNCKISKMSCSP